MNRRKLLTTLGAAAVFTAGFGAAVIPAVADPRTFVVTLLGGKTVTVTLDVPPGTPVDEITIPNLSTPIVGISEVPQEQPPAPEPSTQEPAAPAEPQPAAGAPKAGEQ